MFATLPARLRLALPMALALGFAASDPARAQTAAPPRTGTAAAKPKAKPAEAAPVDLNSATAEELMTLPGVGEATARKIIDGRPHRGVADLAGAGMSASAVEKLKGLAVARPLPPAVDINDVDAKGLETLPGVGPAMAREIIAGRPYKSYDDVAKLKGFGPAKVDGLRGRLKFGAVAAMPIEKPTRPAEPARPATTTEVRKTTEVKKAGEPTRTTTTTTAGPINLNKATMDELDSLPGIGPVHAQAIIDARPFEKIEDVMKVKGIKEVEFGKIKDMITVK